MGKSDSEREETGLNVGDIKVGCGEGEGGGDGNGGEGVGGLSLRFVCTKMTCFVVSLDPSDLTDQKEFEH